MKKREAELTTRLLNTLPDLERVLLCEVKQVERPRRFSSKVLSAKAKRLLRYTKIKHKFSDAARFGTPLDFIAGPVVPCLVVIFWGKRDTAVAYFIEFRKYNTDVLWSEKDCQELSFLTVPLR